MAALGAIVFGISAGMALMFDDWVAGAGLGVFAAICAYGAVKGKDPVAGDEPHRTFRLTSLRDLASSDDEAPKEWD